MYKVITTNTFDKWLESIKNIKTQARIITHVRRMTLGNLGDTKSVGDGVIETRLHFGAGYRIYFVRKGKEIILLLAGGSKRTQTKDIKLAKQIAKLG